MRLERPITKDPEITKSAENAISKACEILASLNENSDLKALHHELRGIRKDFLVSEVVQERDLQKYYQKKTNVKVIEEEESRRIKCIANLNAFVRAAGKEFEIESVLHHFQKEYKILLSKIDANQKIFPEDLKLELRQEIKEIILKHQNEEEASPMAKIITLLTRAMKKVDQFEHRIPKKLGRTPEKISSRTKDL